MTRYNKKELVGEVSLLRLYLLRGGYLLIIVGLALVKWTVVIQHLFHLDEPWELMDGVVTCMLTSFSVLSILGLRYPLQMLPLLLWELLWKIIWLIIVALPLWSSGQMDDATSMVAYECLIIVIFPFIIPWRFVFINYVKKRGDRWV